VTDLLGADLSDYQPRVDWPVYAAARPFVIIKASQGLRNAQDVIGPHRAGAHGVGLDLVGLYHFGELANSPAAEAAHFLDVVGTITPGEVAILDAENLPSGAPGPDEAWARLWLSIVSARTGRRPWLYCSWSYWSERLGSMADYPLWIAAYGHDDPRGQVPGCLLWQYSDKAHVDGVGLCDDNRFAGTVDDLRAAAGGIARPPDPLDAGGRTVVEFLGE
jgi:lysozyme